MANNEDPVSPVLERHERGPELTITTAAVNDVPVELDSTPTSAEKIQDIKHGNAHKELSAEDQAKREKLISERQKDDSVLVDISDTPSADEFAKSEDAEASINDKS